MTTIKRMRPKVTFGASTVFSISEREWVAQTNFDESGSLIEAFIKGANTPTGEESQEFLGKFISLLLRHSVNVDRIAKSLVGISSEPTWNSGHLYMSVPDAIGQILTEFADKGEEFLTHAGLSILPQMNIGTTPQMKQRPRALRSQVHEFVIGGTTNKLIITMLEGQPFELWHIADEQGSEARAAHEAFGRLVSIALRLGIPVEEICREMVGVKSIPTVNADKDGNETLYDSATDAAGRILLDISGADPIEPYRTAFGIVPARAEKVMQPALESVTEMVNTSKGKVYVTVAFKEGKPIQVISSLGKAGIEEGATIEWACRLLSHMLASGASREEIVATGEHITTSPVWNPQEDGKAMLIQSLPHAIVYVLDKHYEGPKSTSWV